MPNETQISIGKQSMQTFISCLIIRSIAHKKIIACTKMNDSTIIESEQFTCVRTLSIIDIENKNYNQYWMFY